jgi:hypothetical protein
MSAHRGLEGGTSHRSAGLSHKRGHSRRHYVRMRKRKLLHRVITPLALALSIVLIGAPSAGAAGADVYGVGGGSISLLGFVKYAKFAFSAHTGPQGDFGSFRFTIEDPSTPLDVHVDVDCVNVFPFPPGAGGWIGGKATKVTPQPNVLGFTEGRELTLGFNDFGEPSDPIADQVNLHYAFPSQACKLLPPLIHHPLTQGNIVISLD